jgi:hypothetical protein
MIWMNPLTITHTWLGKHNPVIDWKEGDIQMTRCPQECGKEYKNMWNKRKKRFDL